MEIVVHTFWRKCIIARLSAVLPRMPCFLLEVDDLASSEVTGEVGDMDGEV